MLHTESPHQGIYAPLSQVMTDSDTDSEEEIHNISKHRKQQQQQQLQQKQHQQNKRFGNRNPPNTLAINQQQQQSTPQRQLQLERQNNTRQRQLIQQQQQYHQKLHSNSSEANHHQPSSYTTNMQNTFRSVMMSDVGGLNGDAGGTNCAGGSNFSSFNSDYDERNHIDADNVAILGSSSDSKDSNNEPMSPARRVCFTASLVLCLFAILGFVWMVPCGEDKTCPAAVDRIKTHNWLNNYTKIELKGGVNVVNGLRSWENNLIFLYRGDVFFPEFEASNTKRNGIICLIGSSGAVAWFDEMVDEPVAIDCTLLDVDRNGKTDCLVVDEYGELGAINPISGQWHWKFRERSALKLDTTDFPIILPDLDGDGVLDILFVTSASLEQKTKNLMRKHNELKNATTNQNENNVVERNYLRIISGRIGTPIGEGYKIHNCDFLRKFQLENAQTITFNCVRNNTEVQRSKTLAELFSLITNKSIVNHKLMPVSKIAQHRHYGQRKDTDAQRNIYSLSGREMVVENRGKCPDDCDVTLILSETKDGKVNILRNFTNAGMYGMVPAQWHFKNSKTKMSGFVMKFWKWATVLKPNITTEKDKEKKQKAKSYDINSTGSTANRKTNAKGEHNKNNNRVEKRSLQHDFLTNDQFDLFDNLIQKRHTYSVGPDDSSTSAARIERSITNITNQQKTGGDGMRSGSLLKNNNYKMQMITETVILVLFIGADTRIENTSQSNIIQFCRNEPNEIVCQPDLNNQENSMLIADLDQDSSQELVSYVSTFENKSDNPKDWKLVTYVRLLRLQSELPQFYGEDIKNN